MNVNFARLKGIEMQLERIADCFEMYLQLQFKYSIVAPKYERLTEEDIGVSEHDDLRVSAQEVEDLLKGRPIGQLQDD